MKKSLIYLTLAGAFTLASCTNLEEDIFGVVPQKGFGNTPEQLAALLGPAYSNVRACAWNWHNQEVTTDVMMVPTRGRDWYDGGNWLNYHRHTWSNLLSQNNDMWGWIFEGGINTVNQLIPQVEGNTSAIAELRAIRAYYYFLALDWYGNVPILTETQNNVTTRPRAEVYAFVEKELTEILPNLTEDKVYGRINRWVAQSLLAKLYLNAQVYKGTPEYDKAIAAADAVIGSGKYSLESNFFSNFAVANQSSNENIWAIPFDKNLAGEMTIQMRTLHYQNQLTYGLAAQPWNGFCSLADFYNTFDNSDLRKQMFIVGVQRSASGAILKDDNGNDLVFTINVPDDEMTAAEPTFQGAGARLGKYEIQRNNASNNQDNDWAMLRLADVHLMRAEAKFRKGDVAGALADINPIRARAGVAPMTALTLDNILEERGRELAWEGWRRNDLIRFGKFTQVGGKFTSKFMVNPAPHTTIFPIPQQRIDTNPGLVQNPGY